MVPNSDDQADKVDHNFPRFRESLREEFSEISPLALSELEATAEVLVRIHLGKPKRRRPAEVANELRQAAKGLKRAAMAFDRLGEQGMMHLFAASRSYAGTDKLDAIPHVDYCSKMGRWAHDAAGTATERSKSSSDDKGGQSADARLRSLIVTLMVEFQRTLGFPPRHTIAIVGEELGRGVSHFDYFVREAIKSFAPSNLLLGQRQIDDAIQWAMPSRDIVDFTPPPLLGE